MSDLSPLKEYRGHTKEDEDVLSRMPSAKAQIIDTQFDAATADKLAQDILAATKNPGLSYSFTIDGIISPSELVGAMKLIDLTYGSSIINYVARITELKCDFSKGQRGQTAVTVRGVS